MEDEETYGNKIEYALVPRFRIYIYYPHLQDGESRANVWGKNVAVLYKQGEKEKEMEI